MKTKINNTEELNKYYKIVNTKLKRFADMNVPKDKLANYLKPNGKNFKKFIENDDQLKNVDGIDIVVKDVVDDIKHMHKDNFFKKSKPVVLESFNDFIIKESIYNIPMTDNDKHQHEKALADIYKVSISYIDIADESIHLYSVNDNGVTHKVMVFTEVELNNIKENIKKYYLSELNNFVYKFKELKIEMFVKFSDIIDVDKYNDVMNNNITKDDIIKTIALNTGLEVNVKFQNENLINNIKYYLFEISE